MHRSLRSAAILLAPLLLAAAGCEEGQTPTDPAETVIDLGGFWIGETDQTRMEMTLRHAPGDTQVTGFGVLVPRSGSRAFRVEGVVDDDDDVVTMLLELSQPGFGDGAQIVLVHYRARPFGENRLEGRLNGGGFDDLRLSVRKTDPRLGF